MVKQEHTFNTVFIKCLILDRLMDKWMKVSNRKKEIMQTAVSIPPSYTGELNLSIPEVRVFKTNSSSS